MCVEWDCHFQYYLTEFVLGFGSPDVERYLLKREKKTTTTIMIKIATANPPKEEKQTRRYEKLKVNFLTVGKFVNRHQLSILLTFADDIHAYTSKLQNEKTIAIIRNCQF